MTNPRLQRAGHLGDFGVISSKIFRQMGMRQHPLCVKAHRAREWFDLRNIACVRRLVPQRYRQNNVRRQNDGTQEGPSVVEGNHDRPRRRWLQARASLLLEAMDHITLVDGSAPKAPSDGEKILVEGLFPLSPSPLFDLVNSTSVPPRGDGRDGFMTNVQMPERSGVDLGAPSPQRARMSSQEANDLEVLKAKQLGGSDPSAQRGISGCSQGRL